MKLTKFTSLVLLGLIVTVAASGCRKRPTPLTTLPGSRAGQPADVPAAAPLGSESDTNKVSSTGTPEESPDKFANYTRNTEIFKANTVYFDFDSSAVKASERSKLGTVADYMKAHSADALSIEGHCDERGTEEYNRSLGVRRATALREEIIKAGVDPTHVLTTSFGKDRPANPGHNEAAWKQNRRGEFILLTPPAAP
jgi:peptidoglycan-associated lipoprotein